LENLGCRDFYIGEIMKSRKQAALKADHVREHARGQWLSILMALAPGIEKAANNLGRHTTCPIHGSKGAFRLFRDANISGGGICSSCGPKPDGFSLLMWLNDWNFQTALKEVAGVLGMTPETSRNFKPVKMAIEIPTPEKSEEDIIRIKKTIATVRLRSIPIHHPDAKLACLYLKNRGLDGVFPKGHSLRFHPRMPYLDEDRKFLGYFPALLALVENDDEVVTIHRTFLTNDGHKIPVECPKKLMEIPGERMVSGAAIRLGSPGRILSVTEGIETALAVIEATGMVTWALVSASLMAGFTPPDCVEKLIIWADLDRSNAGTEAAEKLAARVLELGKEVIIRTPEGPIPEGAKSVDWLDVLIEQGPNAFARRSL